MTRPVAPAPDGAGQEGGKGGPLTRRTGAYSLRVTPKMKLNLPRSKGALVGPKNGSSGQVPFLSARKVDLFVCKNQCDFFIFLIFLSFSFFPFSFFFLSFFGSQFVQKKSCKICLGRNGQNQKIPGVKAQVLLNAFLNKKMFFFFFSPFFQSFPFLVMWCCLVSSFFGWCRVSPSPFANTTQQKRGEAQPHQKEEKKGSTLQKKWRKQHHPKKEYAKQHHRAGTWISRGHRNRCESRAICAAGNVEIVPKRRYIRFRQARMSACSITTHVPWSGSAS